MSQVIKVVVVDDSAFIRKVVKQILSRSPFIEVVATARDGEEALAMVAQHNPDVVTLDLIMPGMDGLEFLRRQMAIRPLPVVVCSISHESAELALAAFDYGAVEFVQKPTALATDRVHEMAEELVNKVKAAASVKMALPAQPVVEVVPVLETLRSPITQSNADVVAIGVSTGGPQALRHFLPQLPADFPVPILVVLHMPVGYTEMYAQRLNEICQLEVVEARDGEALRAGTVFLAPAGRHMQVLKRPDGTHRIHLDLRPFDTQHRPSVDVLFRSVAETFKERVLAIVMTGMGNDGVLGAAHIKAIGGKVLTEAESSCVVYGMPRAVVEAALSDRSAPLDRIAQTVMEMV
jgi:two-component system, chemotaxis family, protein-glutamate methylesterase/glutaminase